MRVSIKGEIRHYQITSVWLTPDLDDPHNSRLKMFFCPTCRTPVIQYKGFISKIVPGELPVELPTVIQCQNCKSHYCFQSIMELSFDTIKLNMR